MRYAINPAILQSSYYKNKKYSIFLYKYLDNTKKSNTFAAEFKKRVHKREFYILVIMYYSQINN